jgi:hypothetical protein
MSRYVGNTTMQLSHWMSCSIHIFSEKSRIETAAQQGFSGGCQPD